jgi:hypothetical protein
MDGKKNRDLPGQPAAGPDLPPEPESWPWREPGRQPDPEQWRAAQQQRARQRQETQRRGTGTGAGPAKVHRLDNAQWPDNAHRPGNNGRRPVNGHQPGNQRWPDTEWPEADEWPEDVPWPGSGRWPGNDGWRPRQGPPRPGSSPWDREDDIPQLTWRTDAGDYGPPSADCPPVSQIAGAPAAANAPLAGRFDAEWCPKGVRVRRNSLLRRRRRAGGGAMVRKATLDRSLRPDKLAAADEAVPGVTEPTGLTEERPRQRRGAGGRWTVWAFRALLWAVLLVIAFRGIVSIVSGPDKVGSTGTGTGGEPSPVAASGFPTQLAEAFALQFGSVYLNFSPASAATRASNLTPFIPVGSDPQFGWNGAGTQQLQSEQVASVTVQNSRHAVVTLLAQVNAGLIELGVPVYASQGGLVVSAEPALLPGPVRATPPSGSNAATDSTAQAALSGQLPAFFGAYASGDQQTLGRFLAPGASVTGLGGAVTFGSIAAMEVPVGGTTRRISVTVSWQLAGQATTTRPKGKNKGSVVSSAPAGLRMTYEMTVVRQNGTWYVEAIGPSDQQPGGP